MKPGSKGCFTSTRLARTDVNSLEFFAHTPSRPKSVIMHPATPPVIRLMQPSSQECLDALNAQSFGSRGHPEFCCKPCAYFRGGKCRCGVLCDQCHEIHDQVRLSKSQRRQIEDLTGWKLLMVMRDSIRIRRRNPSEERPDNAKQGIDHILNILEDEISRFHPCAPSAKNFLEEVAPPLVKSLAKRSTSEILSYARTTCGLNPDFCEILAETLESIRADDMPAFLFWPGVVFSV
eukprot:s2436_g10.t1